MRDWGKKWAFHIMYSQNVWVVEHYSLITNPEPRSKSIATYVRFKESELLRIYTKRGNAMLGVEIKLHGASSLSKKSYCHDCSKQIIDQSRTRPRKRCEICRQLHIKKINKIHSERIMRENRAKTLEKQKKLENQKL